jgi:hypothetical protein
VHNRPWLYEDALSLEWVPTIPRVPWRSTPESKCEWIVEIASACVDRALDAVYRWPTLVPEAAVNVLVRVV